MSNISTLSLNLLLEQVYLEGQINLMYEEILREDDNKVDEESKSMIKKVIDDLKLNADFMFTFGVGISAFIGPINELLTNGDIRLTHYDVTLLVITAFYILLTKSAEDIDKLVAQVKERKLEPELKKVIKFVSGTVGLFKIVGSKVGVTITTLMDVLAFTFMSVPVLNLIKNMAAEKGFNIDNVGQLFAGLTLSAGAYLLKNVLKKRLKESENEWFDEFKLDLNDPRIWLAEKMLSCKLEKIGSKNWEGWTRYVDPEGKILFLDDIETGAKYPVLYYDYDNIYI